MLNDGYIHTINTMYNKSNDCYKSNKKGTHHICGACTEDYAKREDNCIHRACTEDTSEAQTDIKHMLKVTMFTKTENDE